MTCLRFRLRRLLPLYLDHAASPATVARIERHLLDCSGCRATLVRLRDAKSLLGELPAVPAPPFERLMSRTPAASPRLSWMVPPVLRHFAADALIASVLFVAFTLLYTHTASARNRAFDLSAFRGVELRRIAETHDPHVIVQGVVSGISGDPNEENRRFRLTDPNDRNAFVVCEVLDGDPQSVPKQGARVRVWGVTRYDSNPDHRWFEVHPVLKVEVLR